VFQIAVVGIGAIDIPYAAVAPISGAPRTCIERMAWAAASSVVRRSVRNSCGSFVWSMVSTDQPSSATQIAR
jgi:hypothetical protein